MPPKPRDLKVRFWALVKMGGEDECWPWQARCDPKGYGRFAINSSGKKMAAHRFAYQAAVGSLADKMVCHRCDNPPCCNPAHLFLGTNSDNQKDAWKKGRKPQTLKNGPGSLSPRAKLDEEKVGNIRDLFVQGLNNTEIGRLYGVSHATISAIRRGKNWSHC